MKRKIMSATLAMLLCALTLASCGNEAEPAADTNTENGANTEEMIQSDAPVDDVGEGEPVVEGEPVGEDEVPPTSSVTDASLMPPDLYRALAGGKLIVSGEVIEEKESYHTNPDRDQTLLNGNGDVISDRVVTPYLLRVDEVYRGDVKEGDVIVVNTENYDLDPNSFIEDNFEEQLEVGQQALFCLKFNSYIYTEGTTEDDVGYFYDSLDGIFEEKTYGGEESERSDRLRVSPAPYYLTIDLDTLEDDIATAIGKAAEYGYDEEGNWVGHGYSSIIKPEYQ